VRILAYNFLGGGSAKRAAHWESIQRLNPDIVLAQECRPAPADHFHQSSLWRRATARGWGTALYLKQGALQPMAVRGFNGWVTGGELDSTSWISNRPLRVFSIHCPAGDHGYVKTMGRILDRLRRVQDGADLVIGGDFNVAMGLRGPRDVVRMSNGERALLERLADEFGLIPCWQTMNPGVPLAQTLRWSGNRATPYHCDGIFVPAAWRDRLRSCEVVRGPDWDRMSDHNPVLAEVGLYNR
jgi:endonuclease/exonuclease/phosphatase family metal-dependent hydrolase